MPAVAIDMMEAWRRKSMEDFLQGHFYSAYKKRHTLKYMIVCHTAGFVVYVSKPFPGNTTDNEIMMADWPNLKHFISCTNLHLDKGFLVSELAPSISSVDGSFTIPHRKAAGTTMFDEKQALDGQKSATIRIVVECAIRRASELFPYIRDPRTCAQDDLSGIATRVAFFLCNYLKPLNQAEGAADTRDLIVERSLGSAAEANSGNFERISMNAASYSSFDD